MHFRKYILLYTLIPLLILTIASTYYRFVIIHDYIVSYEGECDPYTSSCFVGCEDINIPQNECSSKYYYTKIERHAADLVRLCGDSIVDCRFANICSFEETRCSVTFCDVGSASDTCENLKQEEINI